MPEIISRIERMYGKSPLLIISAYIRGKLTRKELEVYFAFRNIRE